MKIIFATGNQGKMKEINMILNDVKCDIISMKEAGLNPEIIENGSTFEENAMIKASIVAKAAKQSGRFENEKIIVMADDSGLEVDYLDKAPGIYSARFLGEDTSYAIKNKYIIDKLDGVPKEKRTARFVCAIACVTDEGQQFTTRATIEGYIGYEEEGENGFGYDPIFRVDEFNCSTAQLSPEQKNKISHRGKALTAMKKILVDKKVVELAWWG